jgi:hypothetical protein
MKDEKLQNMLDNQGYQRELEIDWGILREHIIAIAMDNDFCIYGHTKIPEYDHKTGTWSSSDDGYRLDDIVYFNMVDVNPEDSLRLRPGTVLKADSKTDNLDEKLQNILDNRGYQRELEIDWGILREHIIAIAMDNDFCIYGYTKIPEYNYKTGTWFSNGDGYRLDDILYFNTAGVHPKWSLILAPNDNDNDNNYYDDVI